MKRRFITGIAATAVLGLGAAGLSAQTERIYEVTITNITKGTDTSQGLVFTPFVLAVHMPDVSIFTLGEPASPELAQLAEGGETVPLVAMLESHPKVRFVTTTAAPLLPGESVMVDLPAMRGREHISLAAMLLPTNDGFIGLSNAALPRRRHDVETVLLPGYDAGSEINDELCASIPGPHCGGEGYNPDPGEGKVHVHSGIQGVGDIQPENYDWRNPVAKVTIRLKR